MKKDLLRTILLCMALLHATVSMAADTGKFSFAVISHPFSTGSDDEMLREAIEETDADNLAFIVVNGMKAAGEPCTDKLYQRRKALLQDAKNGLIVSLAASDWADCRNEAGKSAANGKLHRLRELLFNDEFSLGASRIPVIRQSMTAKYRSFPENARWEMGRMTFATINLPSNNNHYVFDAGRNSEFEDRLVANRYWLQRIFTSATQRKDAAIVLFCDGNPLLPPRAAKRDGYAETRNQIRILAKKFNGRVLIVHGAGAKPAASSTIAWQGNLGQLDAGRGWVKITANRADPRLFAITAASGHLVNGHR